MKNKSFLIAVVLLLFATSCSNTPKSGSDSAPQTEIAPQTEETAAPEQGPINFSKCDMVILDKGKLAFYNSKEQALIPYEAETDSVVNCVFTDDGRLYYCVPVNGRMMLRSINLEQNDPKPTQMADWGLAYEKCVTETYGTVSPLVYYDSRHMLGLYHEFSWDSFSLNEQKLYNMDNGQVTDWDYETWEESNPSQLDEDEEQMEENPEDSIVGYLMEEDGQYWYGKDDKVCLTDNIDLMAFITDPDYFHGVEFEFVSLSPDKKKVLFMSILEWGDYPHGPLCLSSLDGSYQVALEDTDCSEFRADWLEDGSLVYVGYEQIEPGEVSKWNNSVPCVKRYYPDGSWESFFLGNDFQVKKSHN